VAKYALDGTLLWATSAGGDTSGEGGRDIAADAHGNTYVTGLFSVMATFGADEANETVLTTSVPYDAFVAKYASDGTLLWATNAGGSSNSQGLGIATDRSGKSYATGLFYDTATFGTGEKRQTELETAGDRDVFVAKFRR
jgi:hypothetical protein